MDVWLYECVCVWWKCIDQWFRIGKKKKKNAEQKKKLRQFVLSVNVFGQTTQEKASAKILSNEFPFIVAGLRDWAKLLRKKERKKYESRISTRKTQVSFIRKGPSVDRSEQLNQTRQKQKKNRKRKIAETKNTLPVDQCAMSKVKLQNYWLWKLFDSLVQIVTPIFILELTTETSPQYGFNGFGKHKPCAANQHQTRVVGCRRRRRRQWQRQR